jgi:hypothetical protein
MRCGVNHIIILSLCEAFGQEERGSFVKQFNEEEARYS